MRVSEEQGERKCNNDHDPTCLGIARPIVEPTSQTKPTWVHGPTCRARMGRMQGCDGKRGGWKGQNTFVIRKGKHACLQGRRYALFGSRQSLLHMHYLIAPSGSPANGPPTGEGDRMCPTSPVFCASPCGPYPGRGARPSSRSHWCHVSKCESPA